jgi:hypothetical protein
LITVRQICFSAAFSWAVLPEPARLQSFSSCAFSSDVRVAGVSFEISALQIATARARFWGFPVFAADVVLEVLVAVVLLLVVAFVALLVVVVFATLVFVVLVAGVLLVVVALLVVLVVFGDAWVELGLLLPQAVTSAPLTIAPTSSTYSLRVIEYPLGV